MESLACILCEQSDTRLYKVENGYDAVQCARCGLVFVTPRPDITEMKELYQGQETKIDLSQHMTGRDEKTIEARWALRVIKRYQTGGALLEVGSAAGYFLREAQRQGFAVQGIDLVQQFVRFATEVLDVPVFEGTLRDARFAPETFDVVYMRNVLGHLAFPIAEFEIVHRVLKPRGYLVLETGNVAELPAETTGELELPDHLFHFSESTIKQLLERTRFDWIATQRCVLLKHLRIVKSLGFANRRARRKPPAPTSPAALAFELPKSRLAKRFKKQLSQFLRYDVGRILPARGRRCTLVVVARKQRG